MTLSNAAAKFGHLARMAGRGVEQRPLRLEAGAIYPEAGEQGHAAANRRFLLPSGRPA